MCRITYITGTSDERNCVDIVESEVWRIQFDESVPYIRQIDRFYYRLCSDGRLDASCSETERCAPHGRELPNVSKTRRSFLNFDEIFFFCQWSGQSHIRIFVLISRAYSATYIWNVYMLLWRTGVRRIEYVAVGNIIQLNMQLNEGSFSAPERDSRLPPLDIYWTSL